MDLSSRSDTRHLATGLGMGHRKAVRGPRHCGARGALFLAYNLMGWLGMKTDLLNRKKIPMPPGPPRRNLGCRVLARTCAACGQLAGRLGLLTRARRLFARAVVVNPQGALGHRGLGNVLRRSGRPSAAVPCLRRAVRLRPRDAKAWFGLGLALRRLEHRNQARGCFHRTLAIDPAHAEAAFCLGQAYARLDRLMEAGHYFRLAAAADFYMIEAHNNLGCVLDRQNRLPEARVCLRRVLALDPGHAVARHHLAALGDANPPSPPPAYVRHLFDGYAPHFDQHLTEVLHYRGPAALQRRLQSCPGAPVHFERVLDLGCGTGLSGMAFRHLAGHLIGIDLSANMLQEAGKKQIYDELHTAALTEFLARSHQCFDLFVAADVFVYIGDLAPVFKAVRHCCRPGAWFVFSSERGATSGYALQRSGRYTHSPDYIARLAARNGAKIKAYAPTAIRCHNGSEVPGQAHVLRFAAGSRNAPET